MDRQNSGDKVIVTKEDIIKGLKGLGLKKGDTILVHSSLKSFGYVDGGADTVIDALLETVLPDGNVMVPTLTGNAYLSKTNPPIFDPYNTPCWTGIIPETFRKRKEALRSKHPTHSVAVIGKDAEYLIECHHCCQTPCGVNSPYDKLVKMNGYVLLLGVDLESVTLFHYVEELMESDYHLQKDWVDAKIILPEGVRVVTIKIHSYQSPRKFMRMEPYLIENNAIKFTKIGNADIRLIDAKKFTELIIKKLEQDPYCLLANYKEL